MECIFNTRCNPNYLPLNTSYFVSRIVNYDQSHDIAQIFFIIVFIYSVLMLLLRLIINEKALNYKHLNNYDEKIYYVILVMFLSWMMYTVNDYMIYGARTSHDSFFILSRELHTWYFFQSLLWTILIITDSWILRQIRKVSESIKSFFGWSIATQE